MTTATTRTRIVALLTCVMLSGSTAFCDWKPVAGHIMTKWADEVDPQNPLLASCC